jgi:hypothetical protein
MTKRNKTEDTMTKRNKTEDTMTKRNKNPSCTSEFISDV